MLMVLALVSVKQTLAQQPDYFETLWTVTPIWMAPDPTTRVPVIERSPATPATPLALTTHHVYQLSNGSRLVAHSWRQRGAHVWTSDPLPGLATSLPVLAVESPDSADALPHDIVYLLNTGDGRLYAYSAQYATAAGKPYKAPNYPTNITLAGRTAPLWRSDFVCSTREGQQFQWLGARQSAGLLVARCGAQLALVNATTGALLVRVSNKSLPPTAPTPFIKRNVIATWAAAQIVTLRTDKKGIVPWTMKMPANITGVSSAVDGVSAVTLANSDRLYLISASGKLQSWLAVTPNVTAEEEGVYARVTLLPTPTIHKGVAYGVASLVKPDPLGIAPSAPFWFPYAVNISDARKPALLWAFPPRSGIAEAQPVVLSRQFMYSTTQSPGRGGLNWAVHAHARGNGQYAWVYPTGFINSRNWQNGTLAATPYCCDVISVSNIDKGSMTGQLLTTALAGTKPEQEPYARCNCPAEP